MNRLKHLAILVLLGVLMFSTTSAFAQRQPPGPPQGSGQPPAPGGNPRDATPRGPQAPRSGLPPEVVSGPANGPASAAALANIPVPRNADEARRIEAQYRPQLQAAANANRAAAESARQRNQAVAHGDRTVPTVSEQAANRSYEVRHQDKPSPRRGSPADRVFSLLGFSDAASPTEAPPAGAPDADPSLQSIPVGACALYPFLWEGFDYQWQEPIFYGMSLNTCGVLPVSEIQYMEVSQHLYRCGWLFTAFDICIAPSYWGELSPPCQQASGSNYLWCGPRVYYPYLEGGYFVRAYGFTELWNGAWGSGYRDSSNLQYQCGHGVGC